MVKNVHILYFSVKSLAAAGKFKNRRYQKNTNTSKQTMGAFLSWFRGSQALDRSYSTSILDFISIISMFLRIIKLERMGIPDDKILMEINYMVKKVSDKHISILSYLQCRFYMCNAILGNCKTKAECHETRSRVCVKS